MRSFNNPRLLLLRNKICYSSLPPPIKTPIPPGVFYFGAENICLVMHYDTRPHRMPDKKILSISDHTNIPRYSTVSADIEMRITAPSQNIFIRRLTA